MTCEKCGLRVRDKEYAASSDGRVAHLNACPMPQFNFTFRLTAAEREVARATRQAARRARRTQDAYWKALHELEDELEIDLDGNHDLNDYTIEQLLADEADA